MAAGDDAGRRLDDLLETVETRLDRLGASVERPPEPAPRVEPEPAPRVEPEPEPAPPIDYVLLVPAPSGYVLVEQGGSLPTHGETLELPERGERYAVVKIVHTPSPEDRRPWVYLEAAT
jgi:hypothetical protein